MIRLAATVPFVKARGPLCQHLFAKAPGHEGRVAYVKTLPLGEKFGGAFGARATPSPNPSPRGKPLLLRPGTALRFTIYHVSSLHPHPDPNLAPMITWYLGLGAPYANLVLSYTGGNGDVHY